MIFSPRISVILPVFNTEKYVAEAIESVLTQTYPSIELICIDDCSTDTSLQILQSFGDKITIIKNQVNSGIATSRNNGIAIARGEYLAFMDSDDIWEKDKLALQMEQFKNNPHLGISFTHMKCFISPELPEEIKNTRYCPPDIMPGYISATAVVSASIFKKVGYFDTEWKVGEFIDWFARAKALNVSFGTLPNVSLLRRIHATNTGVTKRTSRSDYIKIVKKALERKKQQE